METSNKDNPNEVNIASNEENTTQTDIATSINLPKLEPHKKQWQVWLERGQAIYALESYTSTTKNPTKNPAENPHEPIIENTLYNLARMQKALRAKDWSKAKNFLSETETELSKLDNLPEPLTKRNLKEIQAQLEKLVEAHRALDKRDIAEGLEMLANLDAPLLAAEVLTQQGTGYIFDNQLESAESSFLHALEHDPNHYRAITNLGNIALEKGNADTAIEYYQASLKINPDYSNTHHNLGVAYRRKGEIGKSVRSIRQAQKSLQEEDKEAARSLFKQNGKRYFSWLAWFILGGILLWVLKARGLL